MLRTSGFQKLLWDYYHLNQRDLPWRIPDSDGSFDPYKILVSEVMLQQTQVPRVIPKYKQFLQVFPEVKSLADASFTDVLAVWSGLGYNRRARYLREAARKIMDDFEAHVPQNLTDLETLPGIGKNTAAAILVYSYNQPHTFIETNIRSVYLHHFFKNSVDVHDKEILKILEQTLDHQNPRQFYWALMDYGRDIKKRMSNPNKASKHYVKQSPFESSTRQLRSKVLKELAAGPKNLKHIENELKDVRINQVLQSLIKDHLVEVGDGQARLSN
jgi:A/G-specific adenine glycosylase